MGRITRTNYGCSKITVFSNDQIKALPGANPEIVPAIPGKVILPHIVCYILSPWVADYTNIDGASQFAVNVSGLPYTNPTLATGAILAQGHATILWTELSREFDYTPENLNDVIGKALLLTVTNGVAGPFTGGDATQQLSVQVFFDVVGPAPLVVT